DQVAGEQRAADRQERLLVHELAQAPIALLDETARLVEALAQDLLELLDVSVAALGGSRLVRIHVTSWIGVRATGRRRTRRPSARRRAARSRCAGSASGGRPRAGPAPPPPAPARRAPASSAGGGAPPGRTPRSRRLVAGRRAPQLSPSRESA